MKIYDKNSIEVSQINSDYQEGKLFADPAYQRRKVWNDQDKVRLIETILMQYVIPEVFFWIADRDPETGKAITHIVDGQQRITTIVDYIADQFPLSKKYLLDDSIKESCGNKYFSELDGNYKNIIWGYNISVVHIDQRCSEEIIRNMFYRLNLTNYNLNPQERRHSKDSVFGEKCQELSSLDFWEKVHVFSSNDAKRMLDVEYCGTIYVLANEFIVNQTDGKVINQYYDDYAKSFDDDGKLKDKIDKAMTLIEKLLDKVTMPFISKKAQLYTLFSVLFERIDEGKEIDSLFLRRFKQFVKLYLKFRNGYTIGEVGTYDLRIFNLIKEYKLASSEGVNKINNRMLRYRALSYYCSDKSDEVDDATNRLMDAFEAQYNQTKDDTLEKDDEI